MATRREVIDDLRRQIERLGGAHGSRKSLPFGVPAVDRHLPGKGLTLGSLHEVVEAGPASEFAGSATLLHRRDCCSPQRAGALVPDPARSVRTWPLRAGLHPDRVIYAEACRDARCPASRRRGPAPERPGAPSSARSRGSASPPRAACSWRRRHQASPPCVIRRWWTVAEKDLTTLPTAASTRWRIAPVPSELVPAAAVSAALAGRSNSCAAAAREPRSWILEACDAKGRLALPADLADRPDPAADSASRRAMKPLVTVQHGRVAPDHCVSLSGRSRGLA